MLSQAMSDRLNKQINLEIAFESPYSGFILNK
jgi:ferritin